jgi:hypothetical protein
MIPSFYPTKRVKNVRPFMFKYRANREKSWDLVRVYAADHSAARKWFDENFDDVAEYTVDTVFVA